MRMLWLLLLGPFVLLSEQEVWAVRPVLISWEWPAGIVQVEVYRSTNGGRMAPLAVVSDPAKSMVFDSKVKGNKTYCYYAVGVDEQDRTSKPTPTKCVKPL